MISRLVFHKIANVLLILLFCSLELPSCQVKVDGMKDEEIFQIVLLDDSITKKTPGLGHSIESSWSILKKSYPSKSIFRIYLGDITSYDWSMQTITISAEATKRLFTILPDCTSTTIEQCLYLKPFVVVYNDSPLYGGIFLSTIPIETFYKFPIIYPATMDEKIRLAIQPNNSLLKNFKESDWKVIKDEKVKKIFMDAGIITDQ